MRFQHDRSFYMPAKGVPVEQIRIEGLSDANGVAYIYPAGPDGRGKWCSLVFIGKQAKPFEHIICRDETTAHGRVISLLQNIAGSVAAKAERQAAKKASRAALNGLAAAPVGTVFVRSWGYEQTQVDGLEVVGHFGKLGVEVKVARMETVPGSVGHDSDRLIPVPGRPGGHARRAMLRDTETVVFEGENYSKWDGRRSYHHSWGH